ncbi:hypothetical protein N7519_000244 [Penicillium mononematosum]|uniref:uncharacterized protein n=1 Tax=Penicillium mononematosum TaxID=268346 RepID=UPI0025495C93|nr:uncharacterized protein N7519_000244 [Penicillium mononematosum]KAJ6190223.1 hypothetical protein N7519_000244 [Penicillium mononematosum]
MAENPTCAIEEFTRTTFDYVICGGGTAGLSLAVRLSENPAVTVGVIEAGKYRIGDPLVDTPAAFPQMFENPEYDWCVYSVPQEGNRGVAHHIPRGKLLGGSSGINYMMYVRGSTKDYDNWAELVEDDGWTGNICSTICENIRYDPITLEPIDPSITDRSTMPLVGEFHGTSGPIRTGFNDSILPVENDIIKACEDVTGITNKPHDPWSGDHIGFYHTLGAVIRTGPNKGKRSYAARGYYEENRATRPNLKVLCEALVNRVVLDGNKATGVSLTHEGVEYQVSARREVIVSGGTIQSPQILELSGIGDPEVLKAAGVECKVANSAVGGNVIDHALSFIVMEVQPGIMTLRHPVPSARGNGSCPKTGFFPAKAILSETELAEIIQSIRDIKPNSAFHAKQLEQTIANLKDGHSANMQFVTVPGSMNPDAIGHQGNIILPRSADQPGGVTLAACLQYPVSRGSIHIESADPTKHPIVNPNYGGHPADISLLAAFLRWCDKVTESERVKSSFLRRAFPDPNVNLQDMDAAREAVHNLVVGEYHISGSVAMGAALDARLRVKGVEGLRVVDASVLPNNVSGNIVSTVYAIAEKAADLIREDWDFSAAKETIA